MVPGIFFKELKIQNGRVYKDETIPLEKQGVVNVLGKNAAGKSTIFNLLQVPFYAATPTGHKKDDLVKNDEDSALSVSFEKAQTPCELSLERKKKKWGYKIVENCADNTPHTFNDSVKKSATLLGITQAEFEGSIHLTQGSQHILISGKPAKRKEYISNFFGIDDSYDQIQVAAKEELQKVKEEITKVSALSHTKSLIEQELGLIQHADPSLYEKKIKAYKKTAVSLNGELNRLYEDLSAYDMIKIYEPATAYSPDPEKYLKQAENKLVDYKSEFNMVSKVEKENEQAKKVNATIDELTAVVDQICTKYPDIGKVLTSDLKKDYDNLQKLQYANEPLGPLRKELATLKDLKELPADDIEKQIRQIHVDLLSSNKKLKAMEKGECPECGSTFGSQDIETEKKNYQELYETHDILSKDLEVVKKRNKKAQRRKYLIETIGDIREFTIRDRTRLVELKGMIQAKAEYDEAQKTLSILERQEIKEVKSTALLARDIEKIEKHIAALKKCKEAVEKMPATPKQTEQETYYQITEIKNLQTQNDADLSEVQRKLGEINANNERQIRLQKQLSEVAKKLTKLETLKKDEFFWAKLVDAYGPKGLRVQQLKKMMDVVIRRLPVYTGILFAEKGLTFRHKCDANNVSILACREEVLPDGTLRKFEHDISSFSGGEKGKMSTAFVLTLADCVPPAKRSNILILDEVDSALDEDGQFRFTNDLLPMLKEHYESVFVVSHSQEIQQAAVYDQVWTVVKKNHWSTIQKVKT